MRFIGTCCINQIWLILTIVMLNVSLNTQAQFFRCTSLIAGQDCVGNQLNTITTAFPVLLISPDARAGGMGDAGVAVSPDANAIYWNPSKLAFAENDLELSASFTPWLRNVTPDMSLTQLSGYKRLANKQSAIGGSLRYFSLGNVTFIGPNGAVIRKFRELLIDMAFAEQFSDRFGGGITVRYLNTNISGIRVLQGDVEASQSFTADLSLFYQNKDLILGGRDATLAFGANFSNIGGKVSYTETTERDFVPINVRIGPALTYEFDKSNKITVAVDANKLLVPTPPAFQLDQNGQPIIDPITGDLIIANGVDPDVTTAASGIFGSFSDAPGEVTFDDNGNVIVEKGSVLREELREINIGSGLEYWHADRFAFRAGYFWEHLTKGNRKYVTVGAGFRYNTLGIDLSYLIADVQRSLLANTVRFTVGIDLNKNKKNKEGDS